MTKKKKPTRSQGIRLGHVKTGQPTMGNTNERASEAKVDFTQPPTNPFVSIAAAIAGVAVPAAAADNDADKDSAGKSKANKDSSSNTGNANTGSAITVSGSMSTANTASGSTSNANKASGSKSSAKKNSASASAKGKGKEQNDATALAAAANAAADAAVDAEVVQGITAALEEIQQNRHLHPEALSALQTKLRVETFYAAHNVTILQVEKMGLGLGEVQGMFTDVVKCSHSLMRSAIRNGKVLVWVKGAIESVCEALTGGQSKTDAAVAALRADLVVCQNKIGVLSNLASHTLAETRRGDVRIDEQQRVLDRMATEIDVDPAAAIKTVFGAGVFLRTLQMQSDRITELEGKVREMEEKLNRD